VREEEQESRCDGEIAEGYEVPPNAMPLNSANAAFDGRYFAACRYEISRRHDRRRLRWPAWKRHQPVVAAALLQSVDPDILEAAA